MYSVVFQAEFNQSSVLDDEVFYAGDCDLFHMFVTGDSLSCAYERFKDIVTSSYSDFVYSDIKVLSISYVAMR